jgi:hypothetical protein
MVNGNYALLFVFCCCFKANNFSFQEGEEKEKHQSEERAGVADELR